jgi:protein O-mannosyl-transferase
MKKKPAPLAPTSSLRRPFDWRRLIPFAALWGLTLVAYANSFQAGLIYDNSVIILKDPRLRVVSSENLGLILTKEYWYFIGSNGLYRPLTTLTFLWNYAGLGNGANPAGYHLVNYAIHSVNASLVFLLALALFGETLPALAVAAIWAVHPVATESVTNIVGRADLLATFGVLGALLCLMRARAAAGKGRAAWLVAAGFATAVGVFSKESAIIVIGAAVLLDLTLRRKDSWRSRLAGYAAIGLPCLAFLAARSAVFSQSELMHIPFTDNPLVGTDFLPARLTAIKVIGKQLALLVWPAVLSADYSYNAIPVSYSMDAGVLAGLVALTAIGVVAALSFRRDRRFFFLILFALGALLPTSNLLFPIGTIMAERFLYLPAIGFAGCLVAAAMALKRRAPGSHPAIYAALGLIVLLLVGRTFARNFDWRTEDALWRSAEAAQPDSFRPHGALATGELENAVHETDLGLKILDPLRDDRNQRQAYINAGKVYSDKADSLPPAQAAIWRQRALDTLRRAERIQATLNEEYRREALARGKPFYPSDWSVLYQQIGYVSMRMGKFEDSVAALQKAMRLRLTSDEFINLSAAYLGKEDVRDAEIALLEGTIWRRQDSGIATRMIGLFSGKDPKSCALIPSSGNSFRLNTNCPLVQSELCAASKDLIPLFEAQGQTVEAARVRSGAQHAGCTP